MVAKSPKIEQESFDRLLLWLDADREIAGQKYEDIRLRLVKMFHARGCDLAEDLADETIDKVLDKVDHIADLYTGDPILYFYGVAKNVFLESRRKPKTEELPEVLVAVLDDDPINQERQFSCFKKCLSDLSPDERRLVINYYDYSEKKKSEKVRDRKLLAKNLNIPLEGLRVKMNRIRQKLKICLSKCMELSDAYNINERN